MKPILVHCHIFYPELWEELKSCIKNIAPNPFDLFVTMVEEHNDISKDIQNNFPKAHIDIVKNVGYDIFPFVSVLNKINLEDYSYVVKLHTKRPILLMNIWNLQKNILKKLMENFLFPVILMFKGWINLMDKFIVIPALSDNRETEIIKLRSQLLTAMNFFYIELVMILKKLES